MHRISYILYNYEKDFKPDDFYIVGSNKILLNYITSVLPDLDVNGVRQMTMEELFVRLLYEDFDRDRQHIAPLTMPSASYPASLKRGTLGWFTELEAYCLSFERSIINTNDVILKSNENVLLEHDVRLKIETVKDADEKEWIGVFTSSEEMHKGSAGNVQMNSFCSFFPKKHF